MSHHGTVQHKSYVVAHQHGGEIKIGVAEEQPQKTGAESAALGIHLKAEPVGRHECDLKSRKKR